MRVGLMIEGQEGVTWDQWLALAQACEETGIEALFRSDHYMGIGDPTRGSLDAWTTLAGLAARTTKLRFGTMVSPATFRHPSVLAKSAATVDHISGGRVEVGIGAGWYEGEHTAYGFEFPNLRVRMERFAEQVEIVHRQWTEESVDFQGKHYQLRGPALPKPVQKPRPPIVVGGGGKPGTLTPAVRFANEYDSPGATLELCRERREAIDRACEKGGRDPATLPFSIMTGVIVGADEGEVRERARRLMQRSRNAGDDLDAFLAARRERGVVGTVSQAIERIQALEEAGVSRVFLQHLLHEDVDMVRLIGKEIVPAVTK